VSSHPELTHDGANESSRKETMQPDQPTPKVLTGLDDQLEIAVGPATEIPPGEARRVPCTPPITVFNVDGEFYAVDDTCTHQDTSLSEGWLEGCEIECPLHASRFDLRTGRPNSPPAIRALRTYKVQVRDGIVYLSASEPPS
jgi:3-phenylpropionate/trans-cinnamate dioxygenase ferredoxin component